MVALIEHCPNIFLDEIQEQLLIQHNLDVSLATIYCTLKQLGYSSKKVCDTAHQGSHHSQLSKVATEQCEETRSQFAYDVASEPANYLVCGDKSDINVLMCY
jgi:hypothetical protein